METAAGERPRVLIVDDNQSIHEDYKKVLAPAAGAVAGTDGLEQLEARIFGDAPVPRRHDDVEIQSVYQGKDAIDVVGSATRDGQPFSVAFVDVRMPPGIDGIETTARLWQIDPDLQVVICSAYSDYSWTETIDRLGQRDSLLILRKPFDATEVTQLVAALWRKWRQRREIEKRLKDLESLVEERTAKLRQEMASRERLEAERSLAQRLEAVGQLAAGIAHEINTPMQYVSDNVHFVRDAFNTVCGMLDVTRRALRDLPASADRDRALAQVQAAAERMDVEYQSAEAPDALAKTLDGIARVSELVSAMRDFAHPGQDEQDEADLNVAIATTLTVCRNEYKYVADVDVDFGDLPPVRCFVSELNQVFLNIIVNAAHAVADARSPADEGAPPDERSSPETRGQIAIATSLDGDHACIRIRDDGSGIPAEIGDRIFEPFFTTKEPGRGTGQGLSIARRIVVDRHGGTLNYETGADGTTFVVRVPVAGVSASDDRAPDRAAPAGEDAPSPKMR